MCYISPVIIKCIIHIVVPSLRFEDNFCSLCPTNIIFTYLHLNRCNQKHFRLYNKLLLGAREWILTSIFSCLANCIHQKFLQKNTMREWGVVALLLSIEFLDVIVYTLSKAAMKKGMNDFVFVMYSNAFASCLLLPLTLFFHRYLHPNFFSFLFPLSIY